MLLNGHLSQNLLWRTLHSHLAPLTRFSTEKENNMENNEPVVVLQNDHINWCFGQWMIYLCEYLIKADTFRFHEKK